MGTIDPRLEMTSRFKRREPVWWALGEAIANALAEVGPQEGVPFDRAHVINQTKIVAGEIFPACKYAGDPAFAVEYGAESVVDLALAGVYGRVRPLAA